MRIKHTQSPKTNYGDPRTDIFQLVNNSQVVDLSTVTVNYIRYYYGDGNLAYEFDSSSSGLSINSTEIQCSLTGVETEALEDKDITKLVFIIDSQTYIYYKRIWLNRIQEPVTLSASQYANSNAGRVYCYADTRWVTDSDDNYGRSYYQFAESSGVGVDPIIEWEHQGLLLPAGTKVNKLLIAGMSNSIELLDLEIAAVLKKPNPATRWQTGIDNDGEDTHQIIYRNFFWNNTETEQPAFSGNTNDLHLREFDIPENLKKAVETSVLSLYFKPVGVFTQTRYFRCNYTWLLS